MVHFGSSGPAGSNSLHQISYISMPENDLLYGYVGWWVQRLASVLPDHVCMQAGVPDVVCGSWRIALGFLAPPWPWDLTDPVTRAEFFRWVIDQGYLQSAVG